jgi:2-dehydro-3-deoxyphosphogluconate aldolase / (4S)-4-hydroxy-2-oxoglutarate aldolase
VPTKQAATDTGLCDFFAQRSILPVVSVDSIDEGLRLADALLEGGLRVMEITLRSPNALAVARALRKQRNALSLGIGTVLTPDDMAQAADVGPDFLVSPGATDALLKAAHACGIPYLPGAATVSEMMRLREAGFTVLKFFPAAASGGVKLLEQVRQVLPALRFCPTGGIRAETAHKFLALPNVVAVGGSWIAPRELIEAGAWGDIAEGARQAAAVRQ